MRRELELAELRAESRLADETGRRRTAEMTVIGEGDGVLQISNVHRGAPRV